MVSPNNGSGPFTAASIQAERQAAVAEKPAQIDPKAEEYWRDLFTRGYDPVEDRLKPFLSRLPADPRCKMCAAPFSGVGASFARLVLRKKRSLINPTLCDACEKHLLKHMGGAEVEVTMLFADVRGSTGLAERLSIAEFRGLIDRFFQAGTRAIFDNNGFLDKLIGDEVSAGFVPGSAGPRHAQAAIRAGMDILRATGHGDPGGPWVPVGVGIHTGVAYVGAVGTPGGVVDFTALGDAPNTAARLCSNAAAGEILVSEDAWNQSPHDLSALARRTLQVKGRAAPVDVRVLGI